MVKFVSRWLDFTPKVSEECTDKTDRCASVSFVSDIAACLEQENGERGPAGPCEFCANDDGFLKGYRGDEVSGWRCRACDAPLLCWYCRSPHDWNDVAAVALSQSGRGCCARHAPQSR
jgi:hypothetical protein